MSNQTSSSRRDFLKKASAGAVFTGAPAIFADKTMSHQKRVPPSDKVRIAVVGARNIGWANLRSHLRLPEVECVAICDVDQSIREQRIQDTEKLSGKRPEGYNDFRELYDRNDLDAVILGTPDHWHALQTIYACEAGLDVYVEKPLANSIQECRAMAKAVERYGRVVQVGQQQRSGVHWHEAKAYLQSGKLGKISQAKAWNCGGSYVPVIPDGPVPPGVDYDLWLGPAPKRPFNRNRFHGSFRWYWDYAGGKMTDWGVHLIDIVLMFMDEAAPRSVTASGGNLAYPDSDMETPDTMTAVYEFDSFIMNWEHSVGFRRGPFDLSHGIAFHGNRGTMIINRSGWEIRPEMGEREGNVRTYETEAIPYQTSQGNARDEHAKNFIACIKSREQPVCDIEAGSNVAINAHLGNISYRLGRKIYWDKAQGTFKNDKEADAMIGVDYRNPWKLPS